MSREAKVKNDQILHVGVNVGGCCKVDLKKTGEPGTGERTWWL